MPFEARDQGRARKLQIANRIENLVADEFVGKAPQFRVEQAVSIDDQGVGQIGAAAVTRCAQGFGFMQEPEGSRGRDVAAKIAFGKWTFECLFSDGRARKLDLKKISGLTRGQ